MTIRIGCSGWHYIHWRGNFYANGVKPHDFLKHYCDNFDTVEINNSFYRLPTEKSLTLWRESVPQNFKFSVKASRFITHNKKLKDSNDSFHMFFDRVQFLGDKLGPILFQLPPRWHYNGDRLKNFLASLPRNSDYAFEFRSNSWICEDALELLKKYNASFCIHDMPDSVTPEVVTNDVAYIRFHGNGEKYSGGYSNKMLEDWAKKLAEWDKVYREIFVYFNNDLGGFAPNNALTLKKILL